MGRDELNVILTHVRVTLAQIFSLQEWLVENCTKKIENIRTDPCYEELKRVAWPISKEAVVSSFERIQFVNSLSTKPTWMDNAFVYRWLKENVLPDWHEHFAKCNK